MRPAPRILGFTTLLMDSIHLARTEQCTVCPDGTPLLPEDQTRLFTIPGLEAFVKTCGDVETLAPTQDSESDLCRVLHSVSTFCGCPIIQESHCRLCEAEPIAEKFYDIETGFTSMADDRLPTTCVLVEATLNTVTTDSTKCMEGRQYAGTCGCPGFEPGPAPAPTSPTSNEAGTLTCSLCHDRGSFSFPEKDVSAGLEEAGLLQGLLDLGLSPNCQVVSSLVESTLLQGTRECSDARTYLGGLCGCAPIPGFCDFCPNDQDLPDTDTLLYPVEAQEGFLPSCEDMNLTLTQIKESDEICFGGRHFNFLCGCNKGKRHYFGADSERKQAFLAWIPRCTGFFSLVGSMMIIYDVLKDRKKRAAVYSQLVLAMSLFDICSSMALIFSTAPIPESQYGSPTGIYGAIGNEKTCTAQGFFYQLGLVGSVTYNLMLSVYYVLVIVKSYRESQIKTLRKYFHIPCIMIGFALAFAGLPHYQNIVILCHIAPPPEVPTRRNISIFVLAPISVCLAGAFFNMGWLYYAVLKQNQKANKWRIGQVTARGSLHPNEESEQGESSNARFSSRIRSIRMSHKRQTNVSAASGAGRQLDRVVLWQAVFYLAAFLLTWPFYYVAVLNATSESYAFWILVVLLGPLQGFFNFIVYNRPRWGQAWAKKFHSRASKQSASQSRKETQNTLKTGEASAPLSPEGPLNSSVAFDNTPSTIKPRIPPGHDSTLFVSDIATSTEEPADRSQFQIESSSTHQKEDDDIILVKDSATSGQLKVASETKSDMIEKSGSDGESAVEVGERRAAVTRSFLEQAGMKAEHLVASEEPEKEVA